MIRHTPGPWYTDGPYTVSAKDHRAMGQTPIATIHGFVGTDGREANARLIAAAPDMLAALRELIEQLEAIGIPDWHGAEGLDLNPAKETIAKAEGR